MKRCVIILAVLGLLAGQAAPRLHDHLVDEQEPVSCVVCKYLSCFSLPAVGQVLPAPTHHIVGKTVADELLCLETKTAAVVSYAPKTSPPC
jgi:hypothetical protein